MRLFNEFKTTSESIFIRFILGEMVCFLSAGDLQNKNRSFEICKFLSAKVLVPGKIAFLIFIFSFVFNGRLSDKLLELNLKSSVETDSPGLVNIFFVTSFCRVA